MHDVLKKKEKKDESNKQKKRKKKDGAQERNHFDNPTNHSRGAFYHGEAA